MVLPQGRIKFPYGSCLNRCSFRVSPLAPPPSIACPSIMAHWTGLIQQPGSSESVSWAPLSMAESLQGKHGGAGTDSSIGFSLPTNPHIFTIILPQAFFCGVVLLMLKTKERLDTWKMLLVLLTAACFRCSHPYFLEILNGKSEP